MTADVVVGTGSSEHDENEYPSVTVCRRCPDTKVFIELDNTDGWIASDLTVELRQ